MDQSNQTAYGSDRRLDSWKEIAAFFDRDERTVRRWEKERDLPVHRVPGKGRGSVYAFSSELSQWLKSPHFSEEPLPEEPTTQSSSSASAVQPASNGHGASETEHRQQEPDVSSVERPRLLQRKLSYIVAACILLVAILGISIKWFPSLRIASFIPASLSRKLGIAPKNSDKHHGPANPEALDLYLKGRYEWSRRTPESLNKAVDHFTQAIVRDPNYALAYAGLADTYNLLREYSNMPTNEAYPRAIAAAKKAVELDDSLSDAHRSLAFAMFYWNWDFQGGEREFKRAIELNPNDPVAHHWYGTALAVLRRYQESFAELDRARQLDPTSASIVADKGIILFIAGRTPEAITLLQQIESTDPNFLSPHAYLARIMLLTKDYPAYLAEAKRAAELRHDEIQTEIAAAAKKAFDSGGAQAMLLSIYQVQKKEYSQGRISGTDLAETCSLLGRKDEAIQYLREDYKRHDPNVLNLPTDPYFDTLSANPAFREMASQIGIPRK